MLQPITYVLDKAGVASETVDKLAQLVVATPSGSIDVAEWRRASEVQLVLLAAVVAAARATKIPRRPRSQ